MIESRLHQLFYLNKVLGLSSVVLPQTLEIRTLDSDEPDFPQETTQANAEDLWCESVSEPCDVLVIGRADRPTSTPFAGPTGELLKRMIQAMKISWARVSLLQWQGETLDTQLLGARIDQIQPRAILVVGESRLVATDV